MFQRFHCISTGKKLLMKILIMGAGKMGTFFSDLLSINHRVAVYDRNPDRLRFTYNVERLSSLEEVREIGRAHV